MKRLVAVLAAALLCGSAMAAPMRLLKEINPGLTMVSSSGQWHGATLARLCSAGGCAAYLTDGTPANTVPLHNATSFTTDPVALGDTAYFFERPTDMTTATLWASDGTRSGAHAVVTLTGGNNNYVPPAVATSSAIFFIWQETLWRSDGTAAGTYSLGVRAASYTSLTVAGDRIFFTGSDAAHGDEPWTSDGTPAGTFLLQDIVPGANSSQTSSFFAVGGRAFFWSGSQLWVSDGTQAGTSAVTSITTGWTQYIVASNGVAYFLTSDNQGTGETLWRSDGTASGTVTVASFPYSNGQSLAAAGPYVYVLLWNQIWRSDGTASGTVDITPTFGGRTDFGAWGVVDSNLYVLGGYVNPTVLWKVTPSDPAPVAFDLPAVTQKDAYGIQFAGRLGDRPAFTWSFGDLSNFTLVADPSTGALSRVSAQAGDPSLSSFCPTAVPVALGAYEYFVADDGIHGCSVWRSDGTDAGTVRVKSFELPQTASALRIGPLAKAGPYVYFVAATYYPGNPNPNSSDLWRTDGTDGGTVPIMHVTVEPIPSHMFKLLELGNDLIMVNIGSVWKVPADSVTPVQLIPASGSDIDEIVRVADALLIRRSGTLLRSDGTPAGTVALGTPSNMVLSGFASLGPTAIMNAYDNNTFLASTWRTDGTAGGSFRIGDSYGISNPFGPFDGRIYFSSSNNLMSSDATSTGFRTLGQYTVYNSAWDGARAWIVTGSTNPDAQTTIYRIRAGSNALEKVTDFVTVDALAAARSSLFMVADNHLWQGTATALGATMAEGAQGVTITPVTQDGYAQVLPVGPYVTPFGVLVFGDGGGGVEPWVLPFDTTPDPIVYTPLVDVAPDHDAISSPVQITGINVAIPVSVPGAQVCVSSINACTCDLQPFASSAIAHAGEYVCVKQPPSSTAGGTATSTVTLGDATATFTTTTTTETNFALQARGGLASASSQYSDAYPIASINDNERAGHGWAAGGGWADGTVDTYPDWVQVEFNLPRVIDRVVVYTMQDQKVTPYEPWDTMTFTQSGLVDFTVQGWDGAAWQTLATVVGNNLVKRTVSFAAITTTKIRVNVTAALNHLSRITEVEAWGAPVAPLVRRGIVDFDGDGFADLVFENADGSVDVRLMEGVFARATGHIVPSASGHVLPVAGDFNGDGKTDLLFQRDDGATEIWLMDGATRLQATQVMGPGLGWTATYVADFDGDGRSDIVWRNASGASSLWLMNGTAIAQRGPLMPAGATWTATHVGDFNGDGKADILWANNDGSVSMWVMSGLTVLDRGPLMGATGWRVLHAADFDGDGRSDILWQNTDGTVSMWTMNGRTIATRGPLMPANTAWTVPVVGDFNGDGKTDLVFTSSDGSAAVWLMNGTSTLETRTEIGAGSGWTPGVAGDVSADGKTDLVWVQPTGAAGVWLMDGKQVPLRRSIEAAGSGRKLVPVQFHR